MREFDPNQSISMRITREAQCGQCQSEKDLKIEVVSGWLLCSDCRQKMLDSLDKLREAVK